MAPEAYLNEVLTAVHDRAYYADRVDWDEWRAQATIVAADGATAADTYDFVRRLVVALGDHHSQFFPPVDPTDHATSVTFSAPRGDVDQDSIGTLWLPGIAAIKGDGDGREERYSEIAWQILAEDACGWIIDLRGNRGGTLFPMLVAIAPLVGPGVAVGHRSRDGRTDMYRLDEDESLIAPDDSVLATAPANAAPISTSDGLIAALQGPRTISAGEGVVMALRGRPNVRSFGESTAGLPTGNSFVEFSDGSGINLTVAIGVDFSGQAHETAIPPDSPVEPAAGDPYDAAHAWLRTSSRCARAVTS